MRRLRGLFDRLVDPDHLAAAAERPCRGKRHRPDIAWFRFCQDRELAALRDHLIAGTWTPHRFQLLLIREPRPRVIARATVEDRVMHTAVASLLEPALLRSASPADRACRPGHGQHRAVLALWRMARQHRFALHLDVRSYFPSVDLGILRGLLAHRIDDARFFGVVERILEAGRGLYDSPLARHHGRFDADWPPRGQGLPMGAVTSQLFAAHLYLTALDHRLLRDLRVRGYLRYVDDLFLFADRRADLRAWRAEIGAWLASERRLRLKHPNGRIVSCAGHLDGLGFRIRSDGVEPLPAAQRRVVRRMRELLRDPARSVESIDRSLRAMAGHQFLL